MDVVTVADPVALLECAGPLLADEARNNLILGLLGVLRDQPGVYPEFSLWLVRDGDEAVGAALRTPPHGLMLGPCSIAAVDALVESIEEELPGAVGVVPEIDVFAAAWGLREDVPVDVRFEQGIYALERLIEPRDVPGAARRAGEADLELLCLWLLEFSREALHEDDPDEARIEQTIRQRLELPEPSFLLWEDGGAAVSLAGTGGNTPSGSRVGPVYTPPEHRGRGYGSAVTAAVTRERLRAGRRFCFLYTDLANPTSNKIYVDLGYERVGDSRQYSFS
ncbi:MAG: GNAT family N-acetyltransferase [Actinobacteria bacterium]|nr:GNAT family N-acetyltransferase [Actinomycetota bacterium]